MALVYAVSALITPEYRSDMSVLVIQKQPEDKVDAFSAAKSADYLSDTFSKIIYTDSFINDVLTSSAGIQTKFSTDHEDRKKQWENEVEVKKINNSGIIDISVFDPQKKEAEKIVQAISQNLSANSAKYHGGGDKITITVIDGPITSKMPARPNILLNVLLAFVVGIVGSTGYFYFFGKKESAIDKFIYDRDGYFIGNK
jgi:capsular polysaccharide biosynthesis protein